MFGATLRLDIDLAWEAVARAQNSSGPFATPLDGSPNDPYFGRGIGPDPLRNARGG